MHPFRLLFVLGLLALRLDVTASLPLGPAVH